MDELIEVIEEYDKVQFFISLDYSSDENELYSCVEWADLYDELGEHGNNPLILDTDPDHYIWNMFAGLNYSAYIGQHFLLLREPVIDIHYLGDEYR